MKDENKVNNPLPAVKDPLVEKIKNQFFSEYYPVASFKEGVIFLGTPGIYQLFYNLYPEESAFSQADIARWMNENGFTTINMGDMKYEWMLLPANKL